MRVEVVGVEMPSLPGVAVGVQRGREVVDEHPSAGNDLRWAFEVRVDGAELRGPHVQGRRGDRFFYLSWARDGEMFRRAKLMLDAVPQDVLAAASQPGAALVATVSMVMPDGSPRCAAVRPPAVTWTAARP